MLSEDQKRYIEDLINENKLEELRAYILKDNNEFDNSYIYQLLSPLCLAIITKNFEIADVFIEKGVDINFEQIFNHLNQIENEEIIFKYIFNKNVTVDEKVMRRFIYKYKDRSNLIEIFINDYVVKQNNKVDIYDEIYSIAINYISNDTFPFPLLLELLYNVDEECLINILKENKENYNIFDIKKNYRIVNKIKNEKLKNVIKQLSDEYSASNKFIEIYSKFIGISDLGTSFRTFATYYNDLKEDENYDILIFLINLNMPKHTIESVFPLYQRLNYHIEKKLYCDKYNFLRYNNPLFAAISLNKFDIADVLIENGANINYEPSCSSNIITILYDENYLNSNNLRYIFNHGFNTSWTHSFLEYMIIYWIQNSKNFFLETFLSLNKVPFNDAFYLEAVTNQNYDAIVILYDNDKKKKEEKMFKILKTFKYFGQEFISDFHNYLDEFDKNNSNFVNEDDENTKDNENKYLNLKKEMACFIDVEHFLYVHEINSLIDVIKSEDIDNFNDYMKKENRLSKFINFEEEKFSRNIYLSHSIFLDNMGLYFSYFDLIRYVIEDRISENKINSILEKINIEYNNIENSNVYNYNGYSISLAPSNLKIKELIKDEYYATAIKKKFYEIIPILLKYDQRENNVILSKLYNIFHSNIFDDEQLNNECQLFINSIKDQNLREQTIKCFNKMNNLNHRIHNITKFIYENKIDDLNNYINENKINLKDYNSYNFDLLIYAIQNNASIETIQFIIDQCQYENFNYYIEIDNLDLIKYYNKENNYFFNYTLFPDIGGIRPYFHEISYYITPLLIAIFKKNFKISKKLLERGANINYEVKNMLPWYIYGSSQLNDEILSFLMKNKFNKPVYLIEHCCTNHLKDFFNIKKENNEWNKEYINKIFTLNSNDLVLKLLNIYKNQTIVSDNDLQSIIKNEVKIINDDVFEFAVEQDNEEILNHLLNLKYISPDDEERKKILKKYNERLSNNFYQIRAYYAYDEFYGIPRFKND